MTCIFTSLAVTIIFVLLFSLHTFIELGKHYNRRLRKEYIRITTYQQGK